VVEDYSELYEECEVEHINMFELENRGQYHVDM
jgi:hypothetical protein